MEKIPSKESGTSMGRILTLNYVFCLLACLSFASAFHALTPTLPIYLTRLQMIERDVGILVGAIAIAALISRFFVGRILMRYSEKSIAICGAILFTLTFFAFAVSHSFWLLFFIRLFQGFAFACMDTSLISYVIRTVTPENRTKGISYYLLGPPLASAVATSAGVFIFNEYGFTILLFICAGLSICAALVFTTLKKQSPLEGPSKPLSSRELPWETRIFAPAIIGFLGAFSWGGLMAFFPLFAIQCGMNNPGYFFTTVAAMLILSRLFGGRIVETHGKRKTIAAAILLMLVALATLSFSKTLLAFIFVAVVWGTGFGLLFPISMAYSLEYAGSTGGTAVGTFQAFIDLGIALGPVVAGVLLPHTGYPVMFLCMAFTCIINLLYLRYFLWQKTAKGYS